MELVEHDASELSVLEAAYVEDIMRQYLEDPGRINHKAAAEAAGYKEGNNAAVTAWRLQRRPRVQAAIRAMHAEIASTREEALAVVAAQMRGIRPTKVVKSGGETTETYDTFAAAKVLVEAGQPQGGSVNVFGTANIMLRNE